MESKLLSTMVVSYKVASVSKIEQTKENLKTFLRMPVCFFFFFFSMGYQMGEVVATKLLVVVEHSSQYYQCRNVCPLAILERYFCSLRWWF